MSSNATVLCTVTNIIAKKVSTCWDTLQFPTMLSASVEQRGRNVTIMSKICCGPKLNDIVMTSYFWISHYHRITALENHQNVSFEFSNKKVTFIMSDSLVKLIIEMLILAQKFKINIRSFRSNIWKNLTKTFLWWTLLSCNRYESLLNCLILSSQISNINRIFPCIYYSPLNH